MTNTDKQDALEEIITIKIPPGEYIINGEYREIKSTIRIDRRQALQAKQWQKIDLEKGDTPEEPKICLMYKPNQKELGHRVSVGTFHKLTGDEEIDKWPPKDDLNYVSHIMVIEPPEEA